MDKASPSRELLALLSLFTRISTRAPLWMEVQNVQADANGNYTAQLGASRAQGAVIKNPAILTSTLGHFFGAFWSCRSAAISTLESRISPMRAVQAVRGGSR